MAAEAEDVVEETAAEEPADDAVAAESEVADEAPAEAAPEPPPSRVRSRRRSGRRAPSVRRRRARSESRPRSASRSRGSRSPSTTRGRRQERQGTVVSAGADKTIVVRVDVVKVHPRYKKVVKRSTRLHAHDEQNEAKLGDVVRVVETRPLSRMKRWRLQEIVEAAK